MNYSTGRIYDTPQVLAITVESDTPDDLGFRDVVAVFRDASRRIAGRVSLVVFGADAIGPLVLAEYDAGRYQTILWGAK
jgi:hypothetical protein